MGGLVCKDLCTTEDFLLLLCNLSVIYILQNVSKLPGTLSLKSYNFLLPFPPNVLHNLILGCINHYYYYLLLT